ncbi:IclR family transcriptional regulator [Palleronia sp. LCG004]|uniref:IclR family transcriptional regulator n=1 Tax=Palleronia sp. LCG004 TaxID=3079304 RepID=UPI00294305E7|nr:IclR family transcriptional regulator [Palleronia sp. LCG004]WOI58195.1 IclR family transcriptional regulator [Palleronia sp. LCG004]
MTSETTEKASRGVAAVDRALSIVAALEASDMPRNLSELSRATGLYKSTILRLLESLLDAGYVIRVDEAKYALGPAVLQLGMSYERTNPLKHYIFPIFERLVAADVESPSFHVRQTEAERLCLFRMNSNHSTLDRVREGDRLPIGRGAAGKVLIAFGATGQPGEEFDRIRESGIALSLGERDKLCAGMAAPVFAGRNRLIGALSLSGPRERFAPDDVARMTPLLTSAASELSTGLGGKFPY